ncbi:putative c6 transcription factor [Phaeomoniella chlamydospora]|uniref:Putative c6 transcription factor n=1 Tax=Phaeomoniella chlamydospora TaxID=158046 RepID=A0A0G2G2G5_PHACM|nr:putative c6 transcription factor [Phaeomoniella chlamydospora]
MMSPPIVDNVANFNFSTLYQVLHDVIAELYGQNLGCEESPLDITETITKIFQLERSLRSWELTLPPQVNLIDTENIQLEGYTDPVLQRFRIILTLRKLNLDILLHRPMLIRAMEPYGNSEETRIPGVSPAMLKMQANALQTCVQSAESIISIIHAISTAESEKRQLLGAWWFSLYYG